MSCVSLKKRSVFGDAEIAERNSMQAGFYYTIMKELSWEGIKLTEVISSTKEFTVVVDNALIDKTFGVLKILER